MRSSRWTLRQGARAGTGMAVLALAVAAPSSLRAQGAQASSGPSDAVIAHIAVTANAIDVAMAQLALTKDASQDVAGFAKTMIGDHTAVNKRAAALAGRLKLTPEDNAVSQSLQKGAAEARQKLEGLSGGAFERAYMDREVAYHQAVLDALNKTLIPNADNAELKELLQDAARAVEAHLGRAKVIRERLGKGGA